MNTIRAGLLRWARRIGTWLIRRFSEWLSNKVVLWLEMKAADWTLRKVRPRLRRLFAAAAKWLRARLPVLGKCTERQFNELADHAEKKLGLPVVAKESEAA
jgi:hypothetical protein